MNKYTVKTIAELNMSEISVEAVEIAANYCAFSDHTLFSRIVLCDVNYLFSELEHYTGGIYKESSTQSELELLEIVRELNEKAIDYVIFAD